ncbi:sialin-like isoform X2 [Copidosoma floridanum]|uniref:sialin-like isoform X2 n=1 Tax=Copidosoma floridanum TaxID=29053 RepID=UPI0006C9A1C1|nr:sialin-like isoform X2 [Copidosoma floridanum]
MAMPPSANEHPIGATVNYTTMAALVRLKRGSVQLRHAAREVRAAVRARHIVAALVAIGFALCGAVETSSSVALLANLPDNYATDTSWHCDMLVNVSSRNRTEDPEVILMELPPEERAESIMREAFLWGQVAGPILGGCLVWGKSGPSAVFSRAVLCACLALLLVPAAWRGPSHVALRLFQGLCTGATMPAAHMLAMTWFKSAHRSWYFGCYAAVSVGYCLTGWLGTAAVRAFGRDSLCYGLTIITLSWYFTFGRFVKDTPKSYQHDTNAAVIPWGKLLRSVPVWASAVATMGNQWGDATLALGMTKYLKLIYGFSTANDSVLTTLPHIGHFMAALACALLVDHVRESKIVSTTTARKLVVYTGYAGCQAMAAAWLGIAALVVSGTAPAGALAAIADLAPIESPACAAAACALCSTLGAAGLLAANYFVTQALRGSVSIGNMRIGLEFALKWHRKIKQGEWNIVIAGSWRLVFGVASIVLLITAAVFLAFGKGSPQPWIPSVARPCSHDIIYEQDVLELDYEDVGVQTEPFPYESEETEEQNVKEEQKEPPLMQSTISIINE